MDITASEIRQALVSNQSANGRLNGVTARLSSGSRSPKASDDPVRWGEVEKLKDSASRLQSLSDNLNRAAFSARIASISMEALDRQLLEMRDSLDRAIGFPEGSDGREAALKQFNEYHRLADDYSQPDDVNARKLLDDPERFDSAGALEVAAGENNFTIRLDHQPIHLGALGLDVPEAGAALPSDPGAGPVIADIANASSEEIREMGELISQARAKLKERQAGLAADVLAVNRQEDQGASMESLSNQVASELESADLEAEAALAQSLSLRSSLARSGIIGFNDTRKLALQLLG